MKSLFLEDVKKIFLGGTCNNSTWRDELIEKLEIDYFNPVVDNWTEECKAEEIRQREKCDYLLYTITPKMSGIYSIAEVVDDSNKRPEKTLLCILPSDIIHNKEVKFTNEMIKSLNAVSEMVVKNGGKVFNNLDALAEYLSDYSNKQK